MKHLSVSARLHLFFGVIIFLFLFFGVSSILQSRRSRTVVRLLYSAAVANYDVSAATIAMNKYLAQGNDADYAATTTCLDSAQSRLSISAQLSEEIDDATGLADVKQANDELTSLVKLNKRLPSELKRNDAYTDVIVRAYNAVMQEVKKQDMVSSDFLVGMCEGNDCVNLYLGRGKLEALNEAIAHFTGVSKYVTNVGLAEQLRELIKAVQDLRQFAQTFSGLKAEVATLSLQCSDSLDDISEYFVATYKEHYEELFLYTLVMLIVVLVFSVAVSQYTARTTVSALRQGVEQMQLCATGNFNSHLSRALLARHDEFGLLAQSIDEMTRRIREAIGEVKLGANNMEDASAQLNLVSQKVSQGTNSQASSAEEVSSAMEQMAANIDQNADNATQTQAIAHTMEEKILQVNELSLRSLESVKSITEKTAIISEIAAQTNILALNAAVEAARAGEHGRGFSVVASEIRKLAERSRDAASEIASFSTRSLSDTHSAARALDDVLPEVKRTAQLVNEIATASQEQRQGVDQINAALQQLSEIVQQNAAASEEMATSAEELNTQAESLNHASSYFVVS